MFAHFCPAIQVWDHKGPEGPPEGSYEEALPPPHHPWDQKRALYLLEPRRDSRGQRCCYGVVFVSLKTVLVFFFCFKLGVFFIARCFVHSNTALCSFDHYCGENRHILRIWPQLAFWFLKMHSLDPMIPLRSSSIQPSLFYKQKPHFSKRKSTVQWFLFPSYVLSTFRIFRWLNIKGTPNPSL